MTAPTFESFRAVRWLRTLNLVLQAVLVLTFVGGLNYVAKNHAWRFDLTKYRKFSLSPETLSYIKNLPRPVHVIMTVSPDSDNSEVRGLIDEYVYATEDRPAGRITREVLDVYQNRKRSEELGIEQPDLIMLLSGDKRRAVPVNDLYTLKDRRRHSFQGEQVLTAAMLDVTEPGRRKIYFLTGHRELQLNDTDTGRGLSAVRDQLRLRNFDVEEINLTAARGVPEDAALLIGVAPQDKYSRAEQEMLRKFLGAGAGRLIFFLGPGATTAALGLDDLLLDWGILVHNDLIWDSNRESIAENGDLIVSHYNTQHPITKTLVEYGAKLRLGLARTVMPDPGRSLGGGLNTVAFAVTSTTAWGERDLRVAPKYDPGIDTKALPGMDPPDRLGVAVASERVAVRDNLPFSVRGGKMVVFGTGDMIANARVDLGNLAIFLNAVNWTVDRDRQLSIPPRPVERFQLALSAADFTRLRYTLLLVLPAGTMLLGLLVYWTRRT
jgi:hypothetical protein